MKTVKRLSALLVALAMILGAVPAVFADEPASGTPDGEPPVLISIELSATTVSAPNTIEFTAEATDDVSGLNYLHMQFYCEKTDKYIYGDASATYWDYDKNAPVPYPDGKLHGCIVIDQYLESGTFELRRIEISDNAGNYMRYIYDYDDGYPSNYAPIPDLITQRNIYIVANDAPDSTPPVLTNIIYATTDITAPGNIEITVEATDDVSGLNYLHMQFYCEETDKYIYGDASATYWDYDKNAPVPYPDGKLHGCIVIDQYLESGTFELRRIEISDNAGNYMRYIYDYDDGYPPNYAAIPDFITQREIHVTDSGNPDGTPPVLRNIQFSAVTVNAPSVIELIAEATDGVSGLNYLHMQFYCAETDKYIYGDASATYWDYDKNAPVPYPDGKLHGCIVIDQYLESGTFELRRIEISDNAGNYMRYIYDYDDGYPPNYAAIPDYITQREIVVLNAVPDVTTSVARPEFVEQLAGAEDDAYIVADFSGEATLPETAFNAISGTDKTLDLVSEGVTWRFNGSDIVNDSKPIDLNVEITQLEENDSAEIQDKLEETPAVVMKFAENGVLPGKATIQVKVDYAMREYLGASKELCVYYFNNQTGKLELIAENLTVINDTYVEFPITHCSYYILTQKLPEEPEVLVGDVNGDGAVNADDAIYLLYHTLFGDTIYPISQPCDFNADGNVNADDAIYLLYFTLFGDSLYPLK